MVILVQEEGKGKLFGFHACISCARNCFCYGLQCCAAYNVEDFAIMLRFGCYSQVYKPQLYQK